MKSKGNLPIEWNADTLNCDDDALFTPLSIIENPGFFGERSLLGNTNCAASVFAREGVSCLTIGRGAFEEILGSLSSKIQKERMNKEVQVLALKRLHRSCIYWATLLTLLDYGLAQNAQGVHKFVAISVRA